jgi:hypothetical protein
MSLALRHASLSAFAVEHPAKSAIQASSTSPAIRQGKPVASKERMRSIPDSPRLAREKVSSVFFPSGVTIPHPVTTTRRRCGLSCMGPMVL